MSGSENIVADCLSRPPSVDTKEQSQIVSSVYIDVFDLPELAKRESEDFRTQMINEYLNGVQEVDIGKEKLLCDKYVVPRPILPPDGRFPIFSQIHMTQSWSKYQNLVQRIFTMPTKQDLKTYKT